MSKQFMFMIKGDPDKSIVRAKKLARENGAVVKGNSINGTVSVSGVIVDYRREGKLVITTIRKKPFIVPWALLEKQLTMLFGGPSVTR